MKLSNRFHLSRRNWNLLKLQLLHLYLCRCRCCWWWCWCLDQTLDWRLLASHSQTSSSSAASSAAVISPTIPPEIKWTKLGASKRRRQNLFVVACSTSSCVGEVQVRTYVPVSRNFCWQICTVFFSCKMGPSHVLLSISVFQNTDTILQHTNDKNYPSSIYLCALPGHFFFIFDFFTNL